MKIAVIAESVDAKTDTPYLIQLIAICETVKEAFGEAYDYLVDITEDTDTYPNAKISLPYDLEGDTGVGIELISDNETHKNYVLILFKE